ncbi:MAG TPA: helicase [Paraburkholderia sp.]|nr:helicase [Paraburkholderia sp.]
MKNSPECAKHVMGKDLIFQIRTNEGAGRYFTVRSGRINSTAGLTGNPKFTLTFKDAARGFAILSAKDGKEAFLNGLHKQDLAISGDFLEVLWFQRLAELLQKKK